MFNKLFVKDAMERALKTCAQAALTLLTMEGVNLLNINLKSFVASVLTAGVISLLTSVVTLSVTSGNSASLTVDAVPK